MTGIMTEFTPWGGLIGGALIGLGATLLMLLTGRIAGVSGILAGALEMKGNERPWRIAFILGLLLGGLLFLLGAGGWNDGIAEGGAGGIWITDNWLVLVIGGLLVGFGTRMGNGCTSGHGVCGLARLSVRSIVATVTFMAVTFVTVYVVRHVIGG